MQTRNEGCRASRSPLRARRSAPPEAPDARAALTDALQWAARLHRESPRFDAGEERVGSALTAPRIVREWK